MAFGFFRAKKSTRLAQFLDEHKVGKKVQENLARIKSLQALDRNAEADALRGSTETLALEQVRNRPRDKWALGLLAVFYIETANSARAIQQLERILQCNR